MIADAFGRTKCHLMIPEISNIQPFGLPMRFRDCDMQKLPHGGG